MDPMAFALRLVPESVFDTLLLRAFGKIKIPLLDYVRPRVLLANGDQMKMLIPLSRRTANHHRSMYMGALMIGADAAAGFYAAKLIFKRRYKIDFVFKSASAQFFRRPDGDVEFSCNQGQDIEAMVEEAQRTGERVERPLTVVATVPSLSVEPVAEIVMVLSIKRRGKS